MENSREIQTLIDTLYHRAYDRIWQDVSAGRLSVDEAIDRTGRVWDKASAAILHKTGYRLDGDRSE